MSKSKNKKNIFFYVGQPIYWLVVFCLICLKKTLSKITQSVNLKRSHFALSVTIIVITVFSYISWKLLNQLPDPRQLNRFPNKISTKILDRNGNLLYQIFQEENRSLVSLRDLNPQTINAFLAAEDKDFYKHHGFSLTGFVRAIYKNLFNQRVEGGSTITQQLVKNTLLNHEKTIIRKIKELILSIEIEALYNKDEILETYLNQVGFGGPAYGIEEAAKQYFDINAKDLDLSQSAYLAGLTKAPSKYSPFGDNFSLGIDRRNQVLKQMYENNFINQKQYQTAINQELIFRTSKNNLQAPHFVMLVKEFLVKEYGEALVNHGGLTVTTTLDTNLQREVQNTVTAETEKIKMLNVNNGASLVTDPKTGEILAMVGSKDYFNFKSQGQVNLTTSLRQPGSSIKPLNYALAFENHKKPTDTIDDKPITVLYDSGQSWTPRNYDGKFHGTVTLKQALANSYNIPSILILKENGIENFANFSKKLGISTWDDSRRFGLSMSLGSLEVKMTDLATAYSAFANNGLSTPLKIIKSIKNSSNQELAFSKCLNPYSISNLADQDPCSSKKVISFKTAQDITDILSDNQARSSAFGLNSVLNLKGYKVAVKTGTSNDLRDNWAIGYNKDYLVATWVGNNDNQPMSQIASGVTGASPIWSNIFLKILKPKLASN